MSFWSTRQNTALARLRADHYPTKVEVIAVNEDDGAILTNLEIVIEPDGSLTTMEDA